MITIIKIASTQENEQKLLLHNIHESQIESAKLKNQLNHLQQSKIPNSTVRLIFNDTQCTDAKCVQYSGRQG